MGLPEYQAAEAAAAVAAVEVVEVVEVRGLEGRAGAGLGRRGWATIARATSAMWTSHGALATLLVRRTTTATLTSCGGTRAKMETPSLASRLGFRIRPAAEDQMFVRFCLFVFVFPLQNVHKS